MDELSAGILVVTLLGGLAIARAVRKKPETPELPPEVPPEAPRPLLSLTPREKRRAEIEERARQGLCAYCRERAVHQRPKRVKIRGVFDDLIRMLGGVPQETWRVVLKFDLDTPVVLCEAHHAQYLTRLSAKIAEMEQRRLAMTQEWLDEFHEFGEYTLDEQMVAESRRVLRGETKPPGVEAGRP